MPLGSGFARLAARWRFRYFVLIALAAGAVVVTALALGSAGGVAAGLAALMGVCALDAVAANPVHFLRALTVRDAQRRWPLPAARRVLDVGCRNGIVTAVFDGAVARLFAMDLDGATLAHVARRHPGWRCVRADARALPFRDGAFDAIALTEVIEHLDDPRAEMLGLAADSGLRVTMLETYAHVVEIDRLLVRVAPGITERQAAGILRRMDGLLNRLPVVRALGGHWVLVATPDRRRGAGEAHPAGYNKSS